MAQAAAPTLHGSLIETTQRTVAQLEDVIPEAAGGFSSTLREHQQAVERVISAMYHRLDDPWPLQAMADVAQFSPYYFNRIFRQITGIPPGKFLAALRMETAKRMLLTTDFTVTDVCFEVGYQSLGSFTRDFTQFVGLSPRSLRRLGRDVPVPYPPYPGSPWSHYATQHRAADLRPAITGRVIAPNSCAGLIFVALFCTPVPQGMPVSCALLTAPGAYLIAPVADGCHYILAAAFPRAPRADDPSLYLLPDFAKMWVGAAPRPVMVRNGRVVDSVGNNDIVLRQARLTDPPILSTLGFLLPKYQAIGI